MCTFIFCRIEVLNDVTQEHGMFPIAACYANSVHSVHKILIVYLAGLLFERVISFIFIFAFFSIVFNQKKSIVIAGIVHQSPSFSIP